MKRKQTLPVPKFCHCGKPLVEVSHEYRSVNIYTGEMEPLRFTSLVCKSTTGFLGIFNIGEGHDYYEKDKNGNWNNGKGN